MQLAAVLPDVMILLPGVPVPRVELALLRAAQDLCRRARVWTVWTDPVVTNGAGEYAVDVPAGAQVEVVERMTVEGRPHPMVPWTFLPVSPDDARGQHVVPGRLEFYLTGEFQAQASVRFRVVLYPESVAGIPDAVGAHYIRALADGVLSICMADLNQAWTNPAEAAARQAAFNAAVARARLREWRGHTDGTPRAKLMWC